MDNKVLWPGWDTVGLIGRGSFGAVYEIQRNVFGDIEKAALKVISIPKNEGDIDALYDDGYDKESITSAFRSHLKSIIAEYSLMRKLNGCANIVNCDDVRYVQHDDGIGWDIFIKMELLTPLAKTLPSKISDETVISVAKDICNALIVCKENGIIHRDIKPQNIFLSPHGDYKLGDFGIAKTVEKTMGGTRNGTYNFMAPEVYNDKPYGASVDIYSLGLVLYWLLNERRTPFLPLPPEKLTADMDKQARDRRFSGEQLPPPLNGSEKLKSIVLKACAFDPKKRYASAQEMLNALQSMNKKNGKDIPNPVDLDVQKELTFEFNEYPAGKDLSIRVGAKEVRFLAPTDIKSGQTVHLPGKGKYDSSTGARGDLYITIYIKPKPPKPLPVRKVIVAVVAIIIIILFCVKLFGGTPQEDTIHEHSWKDATCKVPQMCESCGETVGTVANHQWVDATCYHPQICEICDETTGTTLEHSWIDATCDHPQMCEICGETTGTTLEHSWSEATCYLPQTCENCGATTGEPSEHSWVDASYDYPQFCADCELTIGSALRHTPEMGMIAAGNFHSVHLNPDGTVFAVGEDKLSDYANRGTRLDVFGWDDIAAISASSHTVGLKADGTVVAVGVNGYGQCNVDHWENIIAIDAGDNHTVGLREDGTVVAVGDNSNGQCDVSRWGNIIAVAAAKETTYGLTQDGRVLSAGKKNYGSSWNDIIAISAGPYHLVGLKSDGTVVSAGSFSTWNETPDHWKNIIAISAGNTHTIGLRADGTVVGCGSTSEKNNKGQWEITGWSDIVEISTGMYHTLGLRSDGTIVAVGSNGHGQLSIAN